MNKKQTKLLNKTVKEIYEQSYNNVVVINGATMLYSYQLPENINEVVYKGETYVKGKREYACPVPTDTKYVVVVFEGRTFRDVSVSYYFTLKA